MQHTKGLLIHMQRMGGYVHRGSAAAIARVYIPIVSDQKIQLSRHE